MSKNKPDITPDTKVADLLSFYPETEERLMQLSPSFAKLQNPVLRRTVARVTSLQQAAKVGGVDLIVMVDALRDAAGLPPLGDSLGGDSGSAVYASAAAIADIRKRVTRRFDARPVIAAGNHPKDAILGEAERLGAGDCLELIAPFVPEPIISILRKKGFSVVVSAPDKDGVAVYVERV